MPRSGPGYNPSVDASRAGSILARFAEAAGEARDALARAGVPRWELFAKASVWREWTRRADRPTVAIHCRETGLAVRTRRGNRSGFSAASGADARAWREVVEAALAVEQPDPVDPLPPRELLGTAAVRAPGEFPAEEWAEELLRRLEAGVESRSGGRLRLIRASVRTGETGWLLHTGEGFTATHRSVSAMLVLEVAGTEPGRPSWRQVLPVSDPQEPDPEALARLLVDPLLLLGEPRQPRAGVMDLLLDPSVAAHLLAGLVPLVTASPATVRLARPGDRLGSALLNLVDDRAGHRGPLTSPCDGEGLPAGEVTLVHGGVLRRRLASYRDARRTGMEPNGGAVRFTYREPPRTGIANLALLPTQGLPASRILEAAGRCLYLLRLAAAPEVDPAGDRYRLSGIGVSVDGGTVQGWHPLVEVRGRISRLLGRLEAVGSDLRWHQTAAGVVGSPTLLVRSQLVG